ncbi:pigment-dispersing factor [Lasioglossum baleicum]|uniref:pigment-dispersing factor n=1 Tax=Lasioglossum baleicum TaxID=434251 RepID=UPI003FCCF09E
MASMKGIIILFVMLGVLHETMGIGSLEDTEKNFFGLNYPYGGGLDDFQLMRLQLVPQRFFHPKRNSELINSLLALPKNVNNAGK